MNRMMLVAGGLIAVVIVAGFWWMSQSDQSPQSGAVPVDVVVPSLSGQARLGEVLFNDKCAECHGQNASGSDKGPPLVHRIYEPGHHADFAFVRAIREGVRGHHWNYGDMDAVAGMSDKEISKVLAYVRELQRANGIN